jgi:hypothetical protein
VIRTNIEQQRRNARRGTFQVGDIFGMFVPAKGWLFGRIVADGLYMGDNILVYIYDVLCPEPRPLPPLSKEHLLIPPFLTYDGWIDKYALHLQRRPLAPGDRFELHCLQYGPAFYDEHHAKVLQPFEPCGRGGIWPIKFIDDEISAALGIPLIPDDEKDVPMPQRRRSAKILSGPGAVTLHVPLDADGQMPVDAAPIEDALRSALAQTKAGTWEGHGFDLAQHRFDTTFKGPDARKLRSALSTAIKALRPPLPTGWHATVRYGVDGDEERIEL